MFLKAHDNLETEKPFFHIQFRCYSTHILDDIFNSICCYDLEGVEIYLTFHIYMVCKLRHNNLLLPTINMKCKCSRGQLRIVSDLINLLLLSCQQLIKVLLLTDFLFRVEYGQFHYCSHIQNQP